MYINCTYINQLNEFQISEQALDPSSLDTSGSTVLITEPLSVNYTSSRGQSVFPYRNFESIPEPIGNGGPTF